MKVKITVGYDGTNYCGWQVQNNGTSIQQVLEEVLSNSLNEKIKIVGSGRTDAGVHAMGQVASFETKSTLPPERIPLAVNCFLPKDIKVLKGEKAEDSFDARRNAKIKTYCYTMYYGATENPLIGRYATYLEKKPNIEKIKKISQIFVGEHDFKCFNASGSEVLSTTRTIYSVDVLEENSNGYGYIKVRVCGNGFLYNMVRSLVGTLVKVGLNKMTESQVKEMLDKGKREMVGKTFPPQGLCLEKVEY